MKAAVSEAVVCIHQEAVHFRELAAHARRVVLEPWHAEARASRLD